MFPNPVEMDFGIELATFSGLELIHKVDVRNYSATDVTTSVISEVSKKKNGPLDDTFTSFVCLCLVSVRLKQNGKTYLKTVMVLSNKCTRMTNVSVAMIALFYKSASFMNTMGMGRLIEIVF